MNEIAHKIQNKITALGNPDKAKWLEQYVKHNIKSKGVGIPHIRDIVKEVTKDYRLAESGISDQVDFLTDLMTSKYTEDKLSAIIYIQLNWNNIHESEKIVLISGWFDQDLITDWNVCDWLCVRLFTPMIDHWTEPTLTALRKWNKNENQWKARASLVPFAQCKTLGQHKNIIGEFSVELIKRNERFCKTAVGWVLREISRTDSGFVTRFLKEHENWTTNEVIKNATKYMFK